MLINKKFINQLSFKRFIVLYSTIVSPSEEGEECKFCFILLHIYHGAKIDINQ